MSKEIKGITKYLFIKKNCISILGYVGPPKKIPYTDLRKIVYRYDSHSSEGYLEFFTVSGKLIRFEFRKKANPHVLDSLDLIKNKNSNIEILDQSSEKLTLFQKLWFQILLCFFCCMPVGLILMWYHKTSNIIVRTLLTVFFTAIPCLGLYCYYLNYKTVVNEFQQVYESATENLSHNYAIETISSEAEGTAASDKESVSNGVYTATLTAGHYIVGIDIPSGNYDFYVKSGFGNLMSSDSSINEIFDSDTSAGEIIQNYTIDELDDIYLGDDTIVTVTGTLEVSTGCENPGETSSRDQDLAEVELGYGIYAAGDDFAPGTYTIMLVEGSGNIISDPLTLDTGINEIFGEKLGEYGSLSNDLYKEITGEDYQIPADLAKNFDDINDIMYITEFKNVTFKENDLLKIETMKVKLIPST